MNDKIRVIKIIFANAGSAYISKENLWDRLLLYSFGFFDSLKSMIDVRDVLRRELKNEI